MTSPTYRVTKVVYNEMGEEAATVGHLVGQSLQEVAALTKLDPADIEWAIEEYGCCDTLADSSASADWRVTEE